MSLSNENRLGFELVQAQAHFSHRNVSVGQWQLDANETWTVQSGSISDLLLTLHLAPGYAEGVLLWKDFAAGRLILSIDADVVGYIVWGNTRLYRIATSVRGMDFNAAEETKRNLCKCKSYTDN